MTVINMPVQVFNSGGEQLAPTRARRAIVLIQLQRAVALETHPSMRVGEIMVPLSIGLNRYVYPKWMYEPGRARCVSRMGILRRDHHRCGYCGRSATTIDHVLPRSRGGTTTWENCVAACEQCNGFKADRTPDEAGMILWTNPSAPVAPLPL